MASIRRTEAGTWQVQVRLRGMRPITRTFHQRADARQWASEIESQVRRGDLAAGDSQLRSMSLADLLERYRDTITAQKRGAVKETALVNALLRESFTRLTLSALTPQHFADYRDKRSRSVRASTVNHALTLFSHAYRLARSEWGVPVPNPLDGLRRPKADAPRTRRLMPGEMERLLQAADDCRNGNVRPAILFATETAMRRGEILAIEWPDVDRGRGTLRIPCTKTGAPRVIPLTHLALAVLDAQVATGAGRPFPMTVDSFDMAWKRLVRRSGVIDLHFHDLRHEAITRFFEMGLTVPEVALISGHRDPRMLFRYTHLRAEDVSAKLRAIAGRAAD